MRTVLAGRYNAVAADFCEINFTNRAATEPHVCSQPCGSVAARCSLSAVRAVQNTRLLCGLWAQIGTADNDVAAAAAAAGGAQPRIRRQSVTRAPCHSHQDMSMALSRAT